MTQTEDSDSQEPSKHPVPYVYSPVAQPQQNQEVLIEKGVSPFIAVCVILLSIFLIASTPYGFLFAISLIYGASQSKKTVSSAGSKTATPIWSKNNTRLIILVIILIAVAGFMGITMLGLS